LESYGRALAALQGSVSIFESDRAMSLDRLKRAEAEVPTLARRASRRLRRGLERTFGRAQQAIVNGSAVDLTVQSAVLRGGLRCAVYEEALARASAGELASARALLGVLAADLGGRGEAPDLSATPPALLQTAFERGVAEAVLTQLSAASAAGDQERAYEALGRAYGHFILVQDSPRLAATAGETLLAAIRALVAGDEAALPEALGRLEGQFRAFANASRSAHEKATAQAAETPPTPAETERAPLELLSSLFVSVRGQSVATSAPPVNEAAPNPSAESLEGAPVTSGGLVAWLQRGAARIRTGPPRPLVLLALSPLALVALIRAARPPFRPAPGWLGLALTLLLLPVLLGGLGVLGAAPSSPLNPATQPLYLGLMALGLLALLVSPRRASLGEGDAPPTSGPVEAPSSSQPEPLPSAVPCAINWDEEF